MKMPKIRSLKYIIGGLIVILILTCFTLCKEAKHHPRDYPEIATAKTIYVTTEYNSISYYVSGDTLAGFHYEMIEAFAREHNWKAIITPEMSFDKRLQGLEEGKYDIVAYNIPTTTSLKSKILLTTPIILNKQVLVQLKPVSPTDSSFIKSQLDLAGKTLYIVKNSPVTLRIHNLENEIGDTIYVKEVEKYGPEQLISLVAHGDIKYAVCDADIARIASDSLPQIDINTAISFTQFYSWGVNKHSPILLDSLNKWLTSFQKGKNFQRIYQKYYGKRNQRIGL